jgi:thymidylate synthase
MELHARNVHQILPEAIRLLKQDGILRSSRNGDVLVAPYPVTSEYDFSNERVVFWPERDANPWLHLYEALFMIAGRNDIAPLMRFSKNFANYSDDGRTQPGAYGYRWRRAFNRDQLPIIARRLRENPDDRRCVLQMWHSTFDLDTLSKDVPCNLVVTFQRDFNGHLDMTVFCRSNDIIWGCFGANVVHFSMLQEYMSAWIGCPIGIYRQVSVNWHAYLEPFKKVESLIHKPFWCPYDDKSVRVLPMLLETGNKAIEDFDSQLDQLLLDVDTSFIRQHKQTGTLFLEQAYILLKAHDLWKTLKTPDRYDRALDVIATADQSVDWVVAAKDWMMRRKKNFLEKKGSE